MTDETPKIPDPVKQTPRCPLCHGEFDRRLDEVKQETLKLILEEAITKYKDLVSLREDKKARKAYKWCETLEASIKAGAAEVFLCHFCRIGIACNDPFVGHWEEAYAKGEKIFCPACDHEMRFFCTSTGYMLAQCPVKTCRAKMELSSPDRKKDMANAPQLTDKDGNVIALPNVNGATSTPQQLSDAQAGAAPDDQRGDASIILPRKELKQ